MPDKKLSESKKAQVFLCILLAMLACTLAMISADMSDRVLRYPFDVLKLGVLVYFGSQGGVDVAAVLRGRQAGQARQAEPPPAPPSEPST